MPDTTIDLPALSREAQLRADTVNEVARTVEITWTTGATVRRNRIFQDAIDEELSVDPGAVRLERLNAGAPFLNTHRAGSLESVLGVVEPDSARIENGLGTATIRFSERADVEPVFRDIAAGIIRNVSVGYRVHRYDIEKRDGAPELWRAVDWEPLEISAVPIGADPGAQVRGGEAQSETQNPCILTRQNASTEIEHIEITKGNDMPKSKKATGSESNDTVRNEGAYQTRTSEPNVQTPAPETRTAPDPDAIRTEERQRASEIMTLCRRHDLDGLAADLIGRGVTLDTARTEILDKIADADPLQGRVHEPAPASARSNGDADTTYRDAVAQALLHRHNPGAHELTAAGRDFRGMSLIELARHALERQGQSTRGMSRLELAGEALGTRAAGAMSTSDFPAILANVANKTLRQAYSSSPRTFAAWARRATITDFKPVSRTQIAGAPDLEKVLESGEFKYGSIGEGKETYALATYGRIVAITRQVLINDDLDAFTRIPSAFGAAAADLESDIVYAILTQNPNMADNKALFHASHGNLGTAAGVTETALGEAYRKFGSQKGLEGRLISILPSYIITPPGTRAIEARKQMTQTTPSATADVNTFAGRLQVIEEPRLIPSSGTDPWFLAADPGRVDTIEYAYLDGQEGVYTETRTGFEVDGIEIKARHDFAAKAIDWRGLFKNTGV